MFKGKTLREFNDFFTSETKCRKYLFDLKWKKGYCCKRCGSNEFGKGRTAVHARCKRCDYDESITAHTVFHKIQIPLLKAFAMAFHIAVLKKGISTVELAKIYGINQKTAWAFKRKVQDSMGAALVGKYRRSSKIKVYKLDSIVISHRPEHLNGLQRINVLVKTKGSASSKKVLQLVGTLSYVNEMEPCQLIAGHFVEKGKSIQLWNFKGWLTGVHHHCSEKYLQGYLDEYSFRVSNQHRINTVWHKLIKQMMQPKLSNSNGRAA